MPIAPPSRHCVVLGGGAWGTALAVHLARLSSQRVTLWVRRAEHAEALQRERLNSRYLPRVPFPQGLDVTADMSLVAPDVTMWVAAVPSHAYEGVCEQVAALDAPSARYWVSATKGMVQRPEHPPEWLDVCAGRYVPHLQHVSLAGPSFARELAQGRPTAVVAAGHDDDALDATVEAFHHEHVRVYRSHDVRGVQLCGLVKNVLAVAAGVGDGLALGANARSALVTRGMAEMLRLGQACGVEVQTLMGLAGLGDLLLTATSDQSRNRRFGLCLGQGHSLEEAANRVGFVIEGQGNVGALLALAKEHGVSMPITDAVDALLKGIMGPEEAISALMARDPKPEFPWDVRT